MANTRRLISSALEINLRSLAPVTGVITALPVVFVFALGLPLHNPRGAITMAVGANLVAIVSLVGAPTLPLRLAILDAVGMGVSVFLGTLTSGHPWLHTALLAPLCFVAGMAVIYGQTQAVLGSQAVVAYLVLGRFSGSAQTALHLGALVSLGALIEIAALLVLRLPPSLRYQRSVVADVLSDLAHYATSAAEESAFSVLARIDDAQRVLSPRSLFGRTDDRDLRAIVDQSRRARLDFTTLAGLRARLSRADPSLLATVEDSLRVVANGLAQLSVSVRHPERSSTWRDNASEILVMIEDLRHRVESEPFHIDVATLMSLIVAHLDSLAGQLRSIGHLVEIERAQRQHGPWRTQGQAGPSDEASARESFALFRDNLHRDSLAFRHAIRLVGAVLASIAVAHSFALPRGYWVPFSVALILKPDYSTLLLRGAGRIVGTILGASLAAILVSVLHPSYALTILLVGVVAALAYTTWTASFSVSIGLVTSLILILLSVSNANSISTALDRLLDVTLGTIIAALTYLLWPSSPSSDVRQAEAAMFSALARYVGDVMNYTCGQETTTQEVSEQSRAAHFLYAAAESAVARALDEPSSTRGDASIEHGLLTSGLRILRATHALRFDADRGATTTLTPALEQLRLSLVSSLDHLDVERPSLTSLSPRAAYRAAQMDLSRLGSPASIALNLDEIVNAVVTANYLIIS